jgi:hypothetical protein
MGKVVRYRQIIQRVLEDYAHLMSTGNSVQILPVCDPNRDQYLLVSLGWQNKRREHAIVFHARLCDGIFLIEDDRTEEGVANLLLQAGIEEDDIRLAWAGIHRRDDPVSIAA